MLQNLPYFWNTKTNAIFFGFSFSATLFFFSSQCPGLSKTRAFTREKIKLHEMKNEKTTWVIWQILKRSSRALS